MNRADERIERVLAGLRETDAPADLDRRIASSVEKRLAAVGGSAWLRLNGKVTRQLPKLTFAAVAATAVLCLAFGFRNPHRTSNAAAAPHKAIMQHASAPRAEIADATTLPQRPSAQEGVPRAARAERTAMRKRRPETPLAARMRRSRPAPVMPLTTQERLLLQLAREGDPQEIAILNPEIRAKQESEAKAEFNQFFATQRDGDNE